MTDRRDKSERTDRSDIYTCFSRLLVKGSFRNSYYVFLEFTPRESRVVIIKTNAGLKKNLLFMILMRKTIFCLNIVAAFMKDII